ncbi:MAG: hypothetical protein JWL84_3300 [Rhodospirillales bacterium]|jgi:hypothetical protein|nr:hypothetical protein [Rhodospirillales bacterium]
MKALITAFALLSFVGATTVPFVAHAATEKTAPVKKKAKKHVKKAAAHTKHAVKKAKKTTQPT